MRPRSSRRRRSSRCSFCAPRPSSTTGRDRPATRSGIADAGRGVRASEKNLRDSRSTRSPAEISPPGYCLSCASADRLCSRVGSFATSPRHFPTAPRPWRTQRRRSAPRPSCRSTPRLRRRRRDPRCRARMECHRPACRSAGARVPTGRQCRDSTKLTLLPLHVSLGPSISGGSCKLDLEALANAGEQRERSNISARCVCSPRLLQNTGPVYSPLCFAASG